VASSAAWADFGTPGDNAMLESFFATVQHEVLDTRWWRTRDELRSALFVYLEITYNRERRHSGLNYRTPTEFNTEARAKLTSVHCDGAIPDTLAMAGQPVAAAAIAGAGRTHYRSLQAERGGEHQRPPADS